MSATTVCTGLLHYLLVKMCLYTFLGCFVVQYSSVLVTSVLLVSCLLWPSWVTAV